MVPMRERALGDGQVQTLGSKLGRGHARPVVQGRSMGVWSLGQGGACGVDPSAARNAPRLQRGDPHPPGEGRTAGQCRQDPTHTVVRSQLT